MGFLMIGTAQQAEPDPQVTSELYQIHVDPEHFRRGIGRGLHTTGVDFWLAGKVRAARVWVWDFNDRARAFYTASGWLEDGSQEPADSRIGKHRMLGYLLRPGSDRRQRTLE